MIYEVHFNIPGKQSFFESCEASSIEEAKKIIRDKYSNCLILNITKNLRVRDNENT